MLASGVGLMLMLLLLPDPKANSAWPAGLLPVAIDLALLVSALIVRRAGDDDRTGAPRS